MLVFAATRNARHAHRIPNNSQLSMVIMVTPEDVWQDMAIGFKGPIIGKVY